MMIMMMMAQSIARPLCDVCYPNAVWASASGQRGFRIVFDTLVAPAQHWSICNKLKH